jgi:hypothetical protein
MTEELLPYLIKRLIGPSLPVTIVCIAGIFTGIYYWERKPIVSLLTVISFFLLFISVGIIPNLYDPLGVYFRDLGYESVRINVLFGLLSFAGQAVTAGAFVVLLVAIFGWRGEPERKQGPY